MKAYLANNDIAYWLSKAIGIPLILFAQLSYAQMERLTLCTDQAWYPFTFLDSYKASGIFVDIAKATAERMNIKLRVRAIDWGKCQEYAASGKVDGVLGASFNDSRANYMNYPMKGNEPDPVYSLSHVEYVTVTTKDQNYQYNGNPSSILQPVRVPKSYSIAKVLKAEGLNVDDSARGDQANLIALVKDKNGSVVMLRELAKILVNKAYFDDQLEISDLAYKSKFYYTTFSKKSEFKEEKRQLFFDIMSEVRQDQKLFRSFLDKYEL